jgi:hypothetical protein
MIKYRTKTAFPIYDKRGKELGRFIIRLIVNEILATANRARATGFYFYENENNEEITLDMFTSNFDWDLIAVAEINLPTLESQNSLKANIYQRVAEFGLMQQMIESGQNYGTQGSDWEEDADYNNEMQK